MNILILEGVASSQWGGAEKSMRIYSEHLFHKGQKLFLAYEKEGDMISTPNCVIYRKTINLCLMPLNVQGLLSWLKNIYILTKFINENNIDVLLTHTIHGYPIIRICKLFSNIKVIAFFKWIYNGPSAGFQAKWGMKCIDSAKAVSQFVVDYWSKQGVVFCNNPIIPDGIEALGTNIDNVFPIRKLLFLGRIYKGKGLHILLEAMNLLTNDVFTLTVAGDFRDNTYEKEISKIIDEFGLTDKVKFLGFVNDTDNLIQNHDLIVVPSMAPEAQPLVILESMKNNRLVIASDIGGNSEMLNDSSLKKLLFEPSVLALKDLLVSIAKLNKKEIDEIVNRLHNRFMSRYKIENTFNLLDNTINEIHK